MTKEQKKVAIVIALREYQENLAAVQESDIPGGFDQLVRSALVKTLGDKFERIFDQPDAPFAAKVAVGSAKPKPAGKPVAKAGKSKR